MSELNIDDFAQRIIEGPTGLNAYEAHELAIWPTSDRVAAAVWTLKCLANPECPDSDEVIAAILARRQELKRNLTTPDRES